MRKTPRFFGLHAEPRFALALALLPFAILISFYLYSSYERLKENPSDKLLPSANQMANAAVKMATVEDPTTEGITVFGHTFPTPYLLGDTLASFKRFYIGVIAYSLLGLILGLNMGVFPGLRTLLLPFVVALSNVPPITIFPIPLIAFGADDFSKIVIIFLAGFFTITRDIYLAVEKMPKEQITKALTLGASQLQVVYRIVLPQIKPRFFESLRLSLPSAWVYLITAEYISAAQGLGYRISLMRRTLGMDVIIPYVILITLLAVSADWALKSFIAWRYSWYGKKEE